MDTRCVNNKYVCPLSRCVYYLFCLITGNTDNIHWRPDDSSVLITSPSIDRCKSIVSKLKREQQIRKDSLWRIDLNSSTTESARILIDNLHQFAVRELYINETSLDSMCISMLSKKSTKVKKLIFNSSSLPTGSIKQISDALAHPDTSLEGLMLWDIPIIDDDVIYLSDVLGNNKILKILDLSNCDITDKGVQYICKGIANNQTLTILALSKNLHITSVSTSAIVELIKTTTSLKILYLRSTSLKYDDIKTICVELITNTTIQQLVLSKQHEKICEMFPSIKDRLDFVMDKPGIYNIT